MLKPLNLDAIRLFKSCNMHKNRCMGSKGLSLVIQLFAKYSAHEIAVGIQFTVMQQQDMKDQTCGKEKANSSSFSIAS